MIALVIDAVVGAITLLLAFMGFAYFIIAGLFTIAFILAAVGIGGPE